MNGCVIQDTIMCKEKEWVGDDNGDGNYWNAFLICDGHCGAQAAKHVSRRLWRVLKPQLPTSEPPRTPGPGVFSFVSLQIADLYMCSKVTHGSFLPGVKIL